MIEQTLVIFKPDLTVRPLHVEQVKKKFADQGFRIVKEKKLPKAIPQQILDHYNKDEAWLIKYGQKMLDKCRAAGDKILKTPLEYGNYIMSQMVKYMISGQIIIMILEGEDAINRVHEMVGDTEPTSPHNQEYQTIRYLCSSDSLLKAFNDYRRALRNAIHCSETLSDFKRESKIWFG